MRGLPKRGACYDLRMTVTEKRNIVQVIGQIEDRVNALASVVRRLAQGRENEISDFALDEIDYDLHVTGLLEQTWGVSRSDPPDRSE